MRGYGVAGGDAGAGGGSDSSLHEGDASPVRLGEQALPVPRTLPLAVCCRTRFWVAIALLWKERTGFDRGRSGSGRRRDPCQVLPCNIGAGRSHKIFLFILQCKKEIVLRLGQVLKTPGVLRIYKQISKGSSPPGGLSIKLRGD